MHKMELKGKGVN